MVNPPGSFLQSTPGKLNLAGLHRGVALAVSIFLGAGTAVLLPSCSKPAMPPNSAVAQHQQQTFKVRGVLRGINFAGQSVTVEHEDIPGYMPSMTMPLDVKNMAEVTPLSSGDGISFDLVVTDSSSWIENVRKIDRSEVRLPERKEFAAKAAENAQRIKEGDKLPPFELVDQKGRTFRSEDLLGKPLLITFIFTRCPIPNFCPLMSQNFSQVQAAIQERPALRDAVQYLSISFDTEFDSPEVLARYAERYTQNADQWRFATGKPADIQRLTKVFGVYVQSESGTFTHGLCTALVNRAGTVARIWRGNSWKPEEIVAALESIDGNPPGVSDAAQPERKPVASQPSSAAELN